MTWWGWLYRAVAGHLGERGLDVQPCGGIQPTPLLGKQLPRENRNLKRRLHHAGLGLGHPRGSGRQRHRAGPLGPVGQQGKDLMPLPQLLSSCWPLSAACCLWSW